jgi:lon-related putative ATP-dependent protease
MARELAANELRWRCPEEWIPADSTAKIEPSHGIIGQARAVRALEFGLSVESLGFNVFVTGLTGTGRMTAIELHLRPLAGEGPAPDDLMFVYNFARPEQPRMLRLAAGAGVVLRERLEKLLRDLSKALPTMFEGQEFQQRLELALEDLKSSQQELIKTFEQKVREAGFTLVQVQVGSVTRPEILPVVEERPVTLDKVQSLAEEGKFDREKAATIEQEHGKLSEELQRVFHEVMTLREQMVARAEELRRTTVEPLLKQALAHVARAVKDPRAQVFLDELLQDILEHLELFGAQDGGDDGDPLLRYRINVVVDNSRVRGKPIIIETEPSYTNLFGTVEAKLGQNLQSTTSDHMRIRAGSLLRANGGFLVVNAFDALSEQGVWPALKRALRFRRVVIRPRDIVFAISGQTLQPEPVELDVKVLMIGDRTLYNLLHEADEEFRTIFKVLADFDSEMPNGQEQVGDFLALMAKIIRDEKLPHLDRGGMTALVEEAVRLARNRKRISARFSDVADILREAAFLAGGKRKSAIGVEHIHAAVRARRDRHSLPEEKLTSYMLDDVLVVHTEGAAVGQVNGLTVYDLGYHAFGLPGRVSARVSLGREGVVNVEREANLSGATYDKGVLILSGFLRGTFAAEHPLSMNASLALEQEYGGVDGDSASSTEVYAILSALSEIPIRRDLAVTGSVDQNGQIQAIGGVNEKIEGFFSLCAQRGLSGTQGVLIPESNVADLQLDPEVVAAVEWGGFHIYPVSRIEEGIELLMGVPAGAREPDGAYPPDSVLGRCARRLAEMAEQLRRYREV